jgi:regulator of protease activity HflC (stomatin/prohibitin superfamily)
MQSRLIAGLVAALIAWSVTHSRWIALFAFGLAAGQRGSKYKWIDDLYATIKAEVCKAQNASKSGTNPQSAAARLAAKVAANLNPKRAETGMLKHNNDAAGLAGTDKTSMPSVFPAVNATVIEQPRKEISMFVKLIIAVVIGAAAGFMTQNPGVAVGVFIGAFFVALIIEGMKIVPQQSAWVVERLGKFHTVLQPGFNWITPFIDRVAYRHSLKEVPLDIDEQVCITKDNTQLAVDGIIYFQVMDAKLASYGSSNYELAISQLAQTALRSEIGKMELDKTFESRDDINRQIVAVLDEAGRTWGIKVLRYELKSLTPPESILRAMQAQITAEREKRAVIAKSEGLRQEQINLSDGQRQGAILASEGEKQAAINQAQGEAAALIAVAEATASAVRQVASALEAPGGMLAANLKVAEIYMEQFGKLAKAGNTLILPANLADAGSFVATAMTVLDKAKLGQALK